MKATLNSHSAVQQPVEREAFVREAATVGAKRVVAPGNFVLDLQRVGDDGLTGAILVVGRFGRGFDPGEVLLADFHHALGQRRH